MNEKSSKEEIGPLLKRISERMEQHVNQVVKIHGLTMRQMRIVSFLSKRPGQCASQKELEAFLSVSHPTVVSIITSMEKKKMVSCRFDQQDKRTKMVYLHWGCPADYRRIGQVRERLDNQLLSGFSQEEVDRLKNDLCRIFDNLTQLVAK